VLVYFVEGVELGLADREEVTEPAALLDGQLRPKGGQRERSTNLYLNDGRAFETERSDPRAVRLRVSPSTPYFSYGTVYRLRRSVK